VKFTVDKEFIGAIIGTGGKVIQGIQKETGATISIEEVGNVGVVEVSSPDAESLQKAVDWIKNIVTVPEVGTVYTGKVVSIQPFGAFVEFLPGKEGLLHISEISYERLNDMEGVLNPGDEVEVKLLEVDQKTGKFRLSKKALLPKPEGYVERPREERPRRDDRGGDRGRGGYSGGRDDRGRGGDRRDDRGSRDNRGGGDRDRGGFNDRNRDDRAPRENNNNGNREQRNDENRGAGENGNQYGETRRNDTDSNVNDNNSNISES
ncbi:MAG: S1 RNA-binding domain-containing protein, partial [Bacteroidia bacterium]